VLIGTACLAALAASAMGTSSSHASPSNSTRAYVPAQLLSAARANPNSNYQVILQGSRMTGQAKVIAALRGQGAKVDRRLNVISGASATVTGRQLLQLSAAQGVAVISLDRPVQLTSNSTYSNTQQWPYASNVQKDWSAAAGGTLGTPPAIAIVDSGVQARADFGSRLLTPVSITNGVTTNSQGDAYGHGTFVAGIAADSSTGYTGVAPSAPLVSIDVMDSQGMALTSDVIAACDWIVQHKSQYNIRVANFSLHSTAPASIFFDPLDQAVERLWFDGVTIVTAAGNYGTGATPSGVLYAPGNDPFVITVGADDLGGNVSTNNDVAAPWSAWGYTYDGFAKPDVAAHGRYMVGPAPSGSTLALTRPGSVTAPGYIELSNTSFASPVVAGEAAELLAAHPNWTPDQVKGAIMLTATPLPSATPGSEGVGLIDVSAATNVTSPPNPNLALDQFVGADPTGGSIPVFDTSAWQATALSNPSWDTAAWGSAAWGSSALAQALSSAQAAWGSAAWARPPRQT
jgi:serine protease AprX